MRGGATLTGRMIQTTTEEMVLIFQNIQTDSNRASHGASGTTTKDDQTVKDMQKLQSGRQDAGVDHCLF